MTFRIHFYNRDFQTQPINPHNFQVHQLTWSTMGYCDQGFISASTDVNRLLEFSSLLRCPVNITDQNNINVWWGYVDQITIYFHNVQFVITLEDLYNRVNVRYAFISPDNRLADQLETGFAQNTFSIDEYGQKEIVLYRKNIDSDFAGNLRDTFLAQSAFPRTLVSPVNKLTDPRVHFRLKGWFHTLDWMFYENLQGFYANHGPGPGAIASGDTVTTYVAQSFTVSAAVKVKYAYFLLRKIGSPVNNIYARIRADAAGSPAAANLATSAAIVGSTLPAFNYQWIKFTFATPYTLTAGNRYWILFYPNTSSVTDHYQVRTDENSSFSQATEVAKCYQGAWIYVPSVTIPGSIPDLMFRVVCIDDTGSIINAMATAGNQFFSNVTALTTGVNSSPYRANGYSCYNEIKALMNLGTANQRLITAHVSPSRHLTFSEQPDPNKPTVFMDRQGRFFSHDQKYIKPYFPPIGQFATLSGIDRIALNFDHLRSPAYFVDQFIFNP